jgi:hypothetical protein
MIENMKPNGYDIIYDTAQGVWNFIFKMEYFICNEW